MVLRFDRDFHQIYMERIRIHNSFTPIDYDRATTLIQQHTPNPKQRHTLLKILQFRPTTDIYYTVNYRSTDYSILRWLRALGAKVEVLLPWSLREEMTIEIQKQLNVYQFW